MKITNTKIIVSMKEIFPKEGRCDPEELEQVLLFTQTHTNYQRFTSLFLHLPKEIPLKALRNIETQITTSGIRENLSRIKNSKTEEKVTENFINLDNILKKYPEIDKLLNLFKKILNHKLSIMESYDDIRKTDNTAVMQSTLSAIAVEYLNVFTLFFQFMENLYPTLEFLRGTSYKLKPNETLTNLYIICEKRKVSLEFINEKLAGKEILKSIQTLTIANFRARGQKNSQQEILTLLFSTLKANRHINHLEFLKSFLNDQTIFYTIAMLPNSVNELILHHCLINTLYAPSFSALAKNRAITSLKSYSSQLHPEHLNQIASALDTNALPLSSLHIEDGDFRSCSYCINNSDEANDIESHSNLINFPEAPHYDGSGDEMESIKEKKSTAINNLLCALANNNVPCELSFIGKILTAQNIDSLCLALKKASDLKILNLSNNQLDEKAVSVIVEALATTNSPLKELNLARNNINDKGCMAIAWLLLNNKTIKTLNLSDNKITDAGARMLADALRYNTTLKTLYLNNNSINSSAKDILQKSKLQHLSIVGHKLTTDATIQLMGLLANNHFLTSLELDLRLHYDEDAITCENLKQALVSTVKSNQTLTHLELIYNVAEAEEDENGPTANIITVSKSLKELYIVDDFCLEKFRLIAQALAENNTLKSFTWYIDGSFIEDYDDNELAIIFETLKQNTALTTFDISWWAIEEFPEKYQQTLENLLKRNRLLATFLPEAPVVPQFSLLKFREYSKTDFWKFAKTKFPFPATQDYATVQDNIRCSVGIYHLGTKLGSPLFQKLVKREEKSDISAKFSGLLTSSPINVSKKLATQILNAYDLYLTKDPNMCGYILSQLLEAFSNIQTAHLKKLTEYVNLFQNALLKSDLSDTQILEYLNLFHKFFTDFDKENLQPALEAVSGSELNEEQQKNIHTVVYILNRLQKDINLMQELLNKCHKLINAKIETQLPKPDEEITRTFISQLQSKH